MDAWKQLCAAAGQFHFRLYLVNDGSSSSVFTDEFPRLQEELPAVEVTTLAINSGKGAAVRSGISQAQGDFFLLTDIDFPYTIDSMLRILHAVAALPGADIAAGNRDASYYNQVPGFRGGLSRFLRYLIRKRLRLPFDDTQCGLKALSEKGKKVFLATRTNRYLYDLELIVKAVAQKDLRVVPVPVELRSGIEMRRMSPRILLQEAGNFLNIFFFRHRL